MNMRALTFGALIGFVVAFAPSCGGNTCGPSNCDGCCDTAKNTCVKKPSNNNNTTCGAAGNACSDCTTTSQMCTNGTCVGGSGGGNGGGTGTGGGTATGAGTGTGGGNCTQGCFVSSGGSQSCIPPQTISDVNCGINGNICVDCASQGKLCNKMTGVCEAPPATAKIGSACMVDDDCTSIAPDIKCRKTTATGSGTYTNGYCTKVCGSAATGACPTGSTCVNLPVSYGEQPVCWDNCSNSDRCRTTEGYACYMLSGGSQACYLNPLPAQDAGTPADKVGNVCTSAADCDNPPETGAACFSRELNFNWRDGYCSKTDCDTNTECAADGGAICLDFSTDPNTSDTACVRKCSDSSDGGQSDCRAGYLCTPYVTTTDAGQALSRDGFCVPPTAPIPTTVGGACATDVDCQIPDGSIADCIPGTLTDGGPSAYTGGYCSRFDCNDTSECSQDGGADCFTIDQAGNTACFQVCPQSNLDGGQSPNCRTGYTCSPFRQADGGPSASGICDPI